MLQRESMGVSAVLRKSFARRFLIMLSWRGRSRQGCEAQGRRYGQCVRKWLNQAPVGSLCMVVRKWTASESDGGETRRTGSEVVEVVYRGGR